MYKNVFKGRNRTKAEGHYDRYFLGDDIKACIVIILTAMSSQLNNFLTKKRMNKEIIQRMRIIQNDRYQEGMESYERKLFRSSSGSVKDFPSIGSNASG